MAGAAAAVGLFPANATRLPFVNAEAAERRQEAVANTADQATAARHFEIANGPGGRITPKTNSTNVPPHRSSTSPTKSAPARINRRGDRAKRKDQVKRHAPRCSTTTAMANTPVSAKRRKKNECHRSVPWATNLLARKVAVILLRCVRRPDTAPTLAGSDGTLAALPQKIPHGRRQEQAARPPVSPKHDTDEHHGGQRNAVFPHGHHWSIRRRGRSSGDHHRDADERFQKNIGATGCRSSRRSGRFPASAEQLGDRDRTVPAAEEEDGGQQADGVHRTVLGHENAPAEAGVFGRAATTASASARSNGPVDACYRQVA